MVPMMVPTSGRKIVRGTFMAIGISLWPKVRLLGGKYSNNG